MTPLSITKYTTLLALLATVFAPTTVVFAVGTLCSVVGGIAFFILENENKVKGN